MSKIKSKQWFTKHYTENSRSSNNCVVYSSSFCHCVVYSSSFGNCVVCPSSIYELCFVDRCPFLYFFLAIVLFFDLRILITPLVFQTLLLITYSITKRSTYIKFRASRWHLTDIHTVQFLFQVGNPLPMCLIIEPRA
jgi:hypothetical protein